MSKIDFSKLSIEEIKQYEKEIERRKKELADSSFIQVLDLMKNLSISASSMISYLQPHAELDGVLVKYIYKNDKNKEVVFLYRPGKRGSNKFKQDIDDKKLTQEQALSYALNDEGKKYVNGLFP